VCVCSLSYPACIAHAPYCRLLLAGLCHIFPHYLIWPDFQDKVIVYKMCVLISLHLLSDTFFFFILRRISEILSYMYIYLNVKYHLFLSDFNETSLENTQISNLTKTPTVGAKLFHEDRQMNMTKLKVTFHNLLMHLKIFMWRNWLKPFLW